MKTVLYAVLWVLNYIATFLMLTFMILLTFVCINGILDYAVDGFEQLKKESVSRAKAVVA